MTFAIGRRQGTGLLQALLQLGQRFIHQRFDFRHIRRRTFLFEQGNGVFVFLDLLRGVGRVEGVAVLSSGIKVSALSTIFSRGATGKSSFLAMAARCWLAWVRSLITSMV